MARTCYLTEVHHLQGPVKRESESETDHGLDDETIAEENKAQEDAATAAARNASSIPANPQ